MAAGTRDDPSLLDAVRHDVHRLHAAWMGALFPRQQGTEHSVLGRWRPETPGERLRYWPWWLLGALVVAIGYPLAVLGFAARFYSRRFDRLAVAIGLLGVVLLTGVAWAGLALLVRLQLSSAAFLAVVAAGVVATVASAVAVAFTWWDGRLATVGVAYPAAMTAIFLPPAVAALFSAGLAANVYPLGERLARLVLEGALPPGIAEGLKGAYDFDPGRGISVEDGPVLLSLGVAQVLLWLGVSIPVGWALGLLVTLADLVRPGGRADDGE